MRKSKKLQTKRQIRQLYRSDINHLIPNINYLRDSEVRDFLEVVMARILKTAYKAGQQGVTK